MKNKETWLWSECSGNFCPVFNLSCSVLRFWCMLASDKGLKIWLLFRDVHCLRRNSTESLTFSWHVWNNFIETILNYKCILCVNVLKVFCFPDMKLKIFLWKRFILIFVFSGVLYYICLNVWKLIDNHNAGLLVLLKILKNSLKCFHESIFFIYFFLICIYQVWHLF